MTILALEHIVATPETMHGAPRIDGHRVRVSDIAVMHVHQGESVEQIAESYQLGLAQIHAALAYYFDHEDEIEREIRLDDEMIDEILRREPSRLPRSLNGR